MFAGAFKLNRRISLLLISLQLLVLALLTEAFQFFATERHPHLRDVGVDLAGTVAGLALVKLSSAFAGSK